MGASHPPGQNTDHNFRESLHMGYTSLSPSQVVSLIAQMKVKWKGCSYNVLTRNCHSFSAALCQELGVAQLPAWLNELAGAGKDTIETLEKSEQSCSIS